MQNFKRVKLKILESTKPLITSNYIYTDSSLYTNSLTLQKSIVIQHMSELHNELLYINDNTLFSLQNGLIATLDSNITHFSSNEYLAIGTKTETLILNSNYETHQVFNSKIDKIVWYKNKYAYIENDNVVINNTKHKGKDALFLDYYNLFAILDDEIYFVEPNGLVHNEPINIDGYDALFSFHDTFVAAKEGMFSIYTFENYEWQYTNFKINGKVIAVIDNCIYTHEDGYLYRNIAQSSIDIINDKLYRMGNDTLQITNFRNGCVPTPYWHERLNVNGIEMFSAHKDIVMIYANYTLYFIDLENQKLVQKILLTDILRDANSSIIDKLGNMTLESVFVNDVAILRNEAYILINNEHLIRYNYVSQNIKSTKIPHAHLLCVSNDHLYLRTDNSIIDYDSLSETIAKINIEDIIKFDVTDKVIIYLTKDTLTLKTLSDQNNLDAYKDAHIKSGNLDTQNSTSKDKTLSIDNVTSYICNNDYLAYIKNDHIAIIDLSTYLYQIYDKNEPYQTLLLMNDNLISYIKRGNLESIKPRIFVRKLIVEHIKEKRYREAFKLCEQNCINLDIFMNRNLHLREVLDSTSSSAQTINFVTQIYNSYNNMVHDKKTRCDLIDVLANIDYKNDTYEMKTEILKFKYITDEKRNGNDQTACCESQKEFLDFVLKHIDDDICILKIYAKLNMLDKSMELILKNNDYLKDLKTIVNDEEIIKQSLATYDLGFANKIIKNLQSDLYLDFIASIENGDAIVQRTKINKIIDKKETALFYIAQRDNPTDYILDNKLEHLCKEFGEYVKTKNIESFSFLSCFDSIISEIKDIGYARIYANFVYKKNKNESIPFFYDLQDYGRIFEIYLELKEYINACETNRKYIHDIGLYDTIICNIIKESNYAMVAFVNLKYKNDKDNAYVYFLKDKKYKDAEMIKPLPDNYHESDRKEINEGYERLDYLINRINDIKERRVEDCDMTMSFTSRRSSKSTKSKLRDKVGSRYEREWCMDQIRIVVENILKIKQAYCEIGDDRLNDAFNIFRVNYSTSIDAIFDREDEMFDPERPVIQRPNCENI